MPWKRRLDRLPWPPVRGRTAGTIVSGVLLLGACTGERATLSSQPLAPAPTDAASTVATTAEPGTTDAPTTVPPPSATSEPAPATAAAEPSTSAASTTTESTTTTAAPTTTFGEPVPGEPNPACFVVIQPGDSLEAIAARVPDPAVTVESLQTENAIINANRINAGDSLDICPDNGIDDITGDPWVPPEPDAAVVGVQAQQTRLNELFAGTGYPELLVDGDSGRFTRRALCAARLALGAPASREFMEPGSPEEQILMAVPGLGVPAGAPTSAGRWALIDKTCQVMFVGEGNRLVYVFPTSTGEEGYETRNQSASRAFRYNPAVDNGGWHNSTAYPVPEDNPLNGNMYKPIYFDQGQAIHGANNVPPEPRSKGCARLRVSDQDTLVAFLGLGDLDSQVWDARDRIGLTVAVQGDF
jgi:hypothetical protein